MMLHPFKKNKMKNNFGSKSLHFVSIIKMNTANITSKILTSYSFFPGVQWLPCSSICICDRIHRDQSPNLGFYAHSCLLCRRSYDCCFGGLSSAHLVDIPNHSFCHHPTLSPMLLDASWDSLLAALSGKTQRSRKSNCYNGKVEQSEKSLQTLWTVSCGGSQ